MPSRAPCQSANNGSAGARRAGAWSHEIFPFLPHLGQARHDAARALRAALARARLVRRARLRPFVLRRASFPSRRELDVVAEPLRGRRRRAHQAAAHRADGLYRAALSSAAACRGDRHRRPDARRPHGARPGARHQSGLFPPLRLGLRPAQIADARIRRLHARGVRRDAAVLVSRPGVSHRQCPHFGDAGASSRIRRCG